MAMGDYASVVLDRLLLMDELAQQAQINQQSIVVHQNDWRGLSFTLCDRKLVADSNEMTEIIEVPELMTTVPDTPDWMLGLTNFHGEVLTVTDLQAFVGGSPVTQDYHSKILVVKNHGKYIGLMVPEVLGIRYFPRNSKREYEHLDNLLDRFIYHVFDLEEEIWPVMSMAGLLADKFFLME